jgi:HK97 family phage major capsid protein
MNKLASKVRAGRLHAFADAESAYRAGLWAKAVLFDDVDAEAWCGRNSLAITRASSEAINAAGGFLVPDEILAAIIKLRELYGALRATAQIVPMGRGAMSVPRETAGLSVFFVSEGVAPTESQMVLDNVGLVAKKLAALARASAELDEDAAVDLGEWLTSALAFAFAKKEDDCGFNGDGTSTYGGTRGITQLLLDGNHNAGKVTAAAGHDLFTEIDATDLASLIAACPSYAFARARWFVSTYGYGQTFARLAATGGGLVTTIVDGQLQANYLGFPVTFAQVLPTSGSQLGKVMIAFGDMSLAATIGDRRAVGLKRSSQRYFDQDQIGFMGTERVDIVVHDLGDNTTAGPIVGLVGG